ncbi:hypothetical protein K227x_06250 [Rubripirellula lacrimiformis]|uniref:YcxB-like protein domain-containing protein n=1 Tax=Rubripirellula lacrimiformis TaxID=1930273 RepID=A0A517N541_9BACT|nr:hypothetical protein [Rubripirellula lacrimiformis]QDT02252.1 hypothetical protein K227x_06250 [Rubripirellula lacrimiformis]
MHNGLNPYQPPPPTDDQPTCIHDGVAEVSYRLTRRHIRRAEEQFLLRTHLTRLTLASLAMIVLSLVSIGSATVLGERAFIVALIGSMSLAAFVYLAIIHHTKHAARNQQRTMGLVADSQCQVACGADTFTLFSPVGKFCWPNESLKTYRTRDGLIVCSGRSEYVFVPRNSQFHHESYRDFCKRVESSTGS